jgi:hypothetical protein
MSVGHARAISAAEAASAKDPKGEYLRQLDVHRALAERFARREATVGWIRSRVFIPFAALVVLFIAKERHFTQISAIALVTAVFAGLLSWHQRARRNLRRALRARVYYERAIDRVEGRWSGWGFTGTRFLQADHLCAFDLDVFGEGSLFERLATVRTRSGENVLASWVQAPAAPAEIRARQEAVAELRDRVDFREHVALLGATDGEGGDPEPLNHWASGQPVLTSRFLLLVVCSVSLIVLLSIAGWFFRFVGYETVIAAFLLQAGCALWLRGRVRSVLALGSGASARPGLVGRDSGALREGGGSLPLVCRAKDRGTGSTWVGGVVAPSTCALAQRRGFEMARVPRAVAEPLLVDDRLCHGR